MFIKKNSFDFNTETDISAKNKLIGCIKQAGISAEVCLSHMVTLLRHGLSKTVK